MWRAAKGGEAARAEADEDGRVQLVDENHLVRIVFGNRLVEPREKSLVHWHLGRAGVEGLGQEGPAQRDDGVPAVVDLFYGKLLDRRSARTIEGA